MIINVRNQLTKEQYDSSVKAFKGSKFRNYIKAVIALILSIAASIGFTDYLHRALPDDYIILPVANGIFFMLCAYKAIEMLVKEKYRQAPLGILYQEIADKNKTILKTEFENSYNDTCKVILTVVQNNNEVVRKVLTDIPHAVKIDEKDWIVDLADGKIYSPYDD